MASPVIQRAAASKVAPRYQAGPLAGGDRSGQEAEHLKGRQFGPGPTPNSGKSTAIGGLMQRQNQRERQAGKGVRGGTDA
jgi:hypothetical protein